MLDIWMMVVFNAIAMTVLFFAILWTVSWINELVLFVIKVNKNESAKLNPKSICTFAFLWAFFFFVIRMISLI